LKTERDPCRRSHPQTP